MRNNHRTPGKFYEHKQGNVNLTIFEIDRYERTVKNGKRKGEKEIEVNRYRRETAPDLLVAESFLVQYKGRDRVWDKDGDFVQETYDRMIRMQDMMMENRDRRAELIKYLK